MAALLSLQVLVHALSGSVGSMVSLATFFPLDSLRTRLQAEHPAAVCAQKGGGHALQVLVRLARAEGSLALYQGLSAVLWTMGVSMFLYFYAYNGIKLIVLQWLGVEALSPAFNLAVAAAAGTVNVMVTTPLWLVNTRMKVACSERRPYANLLDGLVRVCREEGFATLWDGTLPSLMLVSNPAIQWVVYEQAKQLMLHGDGAYAMVVATAGAELTALEFFLLGAVSKLVSTLMTYPLQVAQTLLRYNTAAESDMGNPRKRYSGTVDCLQKMYGSGGIRAMYRGLEAKLWQTVLTAAFQLMVYEQLVALFSAFV